MGAGKGASSLPAPPRPTHVWLRPMRPQWVSHTAFLAMVGAQQAPSSCVKRNTWSRPPCFCQKGYVCRRRDGAAGKRAGTCEWVGGSGGGNGEGTGGAAWVAGRPGVWGWLGRQGGGALGTASWCEKGPMCAGTACSLMRRHILT